jgi:Ca2+-binding RTX toxin-like protein
VGQQRGNRRAIAILLVSMLLVALTAGAALAANINGTAATDLIGPAPYKGTSLTGNDVVRSLGGNDRVDPYLGNDTVYGGEGDDEVLGAEGNDNIKGENGDDTIDLAVFDSPNAQDKGYGGAGDDVFSAEDGNKDLLNCGTGDDTVLSSDAGLDVVSNTCEG